MDYIIILKDGTAFTTAYYDYENHWDESFFMVIKGNEYSTNGKNFIAMDEDHL